MTSNTDRAKLFVTGHRGLVGQALRRSGAQAVAGYERVDR
jgi:hypothetical protein